MAYIITFVVALCSIVYELLMAQTLSVLLGNTVLQYSITIGVYLASLGIGSILCKEETTGNVNRLLRIEVWLSLVGGVSVILQNLWDVLFRYLDGNYSFWSAGAGGSILWILYIFLCYGVIVAIGILSGFELPLLISLRKFEKENTVNKVLGVDYFGSLMGAVCFPLLLWPKMGLFAVAPFIGLLNALACGLLLVGKRATEKLRYTVWTVLIAAFLAELLWYSPDIEQFFLQKLYYYRDVQTVGQLLDPLKARPTVEAFRSPYQRIHLVYNRDSPDNYRVYASYSDKFLHQPDFLKGYYLFLNKAYQFYSAIEEFWHEFFVHVPIQWTQPPTHVLVLGGGDGIVARELLKYESVQSMTLVDLDPVMLELARNHPILRKINDNSFGDPRVHLINADAFSWVRDCKRQYDAVYIDMPEPATYELSKLYSVEFYSMVRRCLTENGFVAADVPYSEPSGGFYLWRQYYSTFHAAGFKRIRRFANMVETDNPSLRQFEKEWVEERANQAGSDPAALTGEAEQEALKEQFREFVNTTVYDMSQGFVFLQPEASPLRTTFQDYGIPLYVLNEERFRLATADAFDYPETYSPQQVNSIFHPTIPSLELSTEFSPYNPY